MSCISWFRNTTSQYCCFDVGTLNRYFKKDSSKQVTEHVSNSSHEKEAIKKEENKDIDLNHLLEIILDLEEKGINVKVSYFLLFTISYCILEEEITRIKRFVVSVMQSANYFFLHLSICLMDVNI